MRQPYFAGQGVTLHVGDALSVVSGLPKDSAGCVVTSPPYWGKRDYGDAGQYGLEPDSGAYIAHLGSVFAAVRRVLADDGTLWITIGDCYAGSWGNYVAPGSAAGTRQDPGRLRRYGTFRPPQAGLRRGKNLLGLPWRLATVLQDSGWWLRNAIIWHKTNATPESVTDRLSTRYETIFLLTKRRRYWFDLDALRAPTPEKAGAAGLGGLHGAAAELRPSLRPAARRRRSGATTRPASITSGYDPAAAPGRNIGDVWELPARPFPGAHFAVQPIDIPLRCVAAGCRPGAAVLDPFSGAGTTLLAARRLGHPAIGVDLRSDYHDLALQRLGIQDLGEESR